MIVEDPDKLNKGLEEQFKSGLDHKLKSGYKGHLGLGFEKVFISTDSHLISELEVTRNLFMSMDLILLRRLALKHDFMHYCCLRLERVLGRLLTRRVSIGCTGHNLSIDPEYFDST